MKSIDIEPKCRPEGRSFPRRKVTAKSLILNGANGDFDMELSLAIQESLKYAAQEKENVMRRKSLVNSNGYNSEDSGSVSNCDAEHSNKATISTVPANSNGTNGFDTSAEAEEVSRLKDLLLTQAEYIQCQQEDIELKDQEISDLVAAKDALQCRLERMERRMSNLKHKEEDDSQGKIADVSNIKKIADEITSLQNHSKGNPGTSNGDVKHKKRSRSHHFVRKKQSKYRRIDFLQSGETLGKESGDDGSGFSQSDDEEEMHTDHDEDKENEPESETQAIEQSEMLIDYPIMQTEQNYHVYYPKHVFASLEGDTVHERLAAQLKVETPTWRIRTFANMYQLEGTENITDEAYLKRHSRHEIEEKRRKRWDLQRIRELKVYEKHQRQKEEEMRASEEEEDVETFLPSVQQVKEIEITDALPVMAFGQPIPYASPGEFEIPWEMSSSPSSATTSRLKSLPSHSKRH